MRSAHSSVILALSAILFLPLVLADEIKVTHEGQTEVDTLATLEVKPLENLLLLDLTFNEETVSNSRSCSSFFDAETVTRLGRNAICFDINSKKLRVLLQSDTLLKAGDELVSRNQAKIVIGELEGKEIARFKERSSLQRAWEILQRKQFVDLTHAFAPHVPHWAGFPDEQREAIFWYAKEEVKDEEKKSKLVGEGLFAQMYSHVGQWGTHADPPAHFVRRLRTLDQIDVKEMILPLVVIDIHEQVNASADYVVRMEDVRAWEEKYGDIPPQSFVALRTDWHNRWPDANLMANKDNEGVSHFPGWSLEVLKFLYEQRHIAASGHETTDTDSGLATSAGDFTCETYVLGTNHYQVELLANLSEVPEHGALVVATFPKPEGGSGFPARVFAILP